MKTYAFRVEVEISPDSDPQPELKAALEAVAVELNKLRAPEADPPFRVTVFDLGWK